MPNVNLTANEINNIINIFETSENYPTNWMLNLVEKLKDEKRRCMI